MLAGLSVPTSVGAEGPASSVSPDGGGDFSASRAQAVETEDSALLVGFVYRDEQGNLPVRVRALGANGAVCGSATVTVLEGSAFGFYRMDVYGASVREGCPSAGGAVAFRALYGRVDAGSYAAPNVAVRYEPGATLVVSLRPTASGAHGPMAHWIGELPRTSGGEATLTWIGLDGARVQDALAPLGLEIARAVHWDEGSRRWVGYTPGGPSFLQTYTTVAYGDTVRIRLK